MIQLSFEPTAFPRTITRSKWKDIWQWKRVTQKKLNAHWLEQMNNFRTYGNTWPPQVREDFMDQVINPGIVMHDLQNPSHSTNPSPHAQRQNLGD